MSGNKARKKFEMIPNDTYDSLYKPRMYRIRALRDFGKVKEGALGGYLIAEECLSHDGDCWVADRANVSDRHARITENAQIADNASISCAAQISGQARIDGVTTILCAAQISGDVHITGESQLGGGSSRASAPVISGNTRLKNVHVRGSMTIKEGVYEDQAITDQSNLDQIRLDSRSKHLGKLAHLRQLAQVRIVMRRKAAPHSKR